MSDRAERPFTDEQLETTLRDIGTRLAYPRTADLLPVVRARIAHEPSRASFWDLIRSPRLSYVPALATLAILALATIAFQPIAATAAEALGLRGITIFRAVETPPSVPVRGARELLADAKRMATVEGASTEVGFTVRAPRDLGDPDEVYVKVADGVTQAFLVYGPRPGVSVSRESGVAVLVTQVRGGLDMQLLGKVVPAGGRTEQLTVNGGRGVWIEGQPHQFFYLSPSGQILVDTIRLAGNVLVWEQSGLLMRIEANVTRDQALRIASSMR